MQSILTRPQTQMAGRWLWVMLAGRAALFAGFQVLLALGAAVAGRASAWSDAAAWWPFSVSLTNIVCLLVLNALFHAEGRRYWDVFRIRRETVKGDLLALLAALVVSGPVSFLPNILLAGWLFGDSSQALALLVQPLPAWAVYAGRSCSR
jgi:hypothetical protein